MSAIASKFTINKVAAAEICLHLQGEIVSRTCSGGALLPPPAVLSPEDVLKEVEGLKAELTKTQAIGAEWSSISDPGGRVFYLHKKSGEVTWDQPPILRERAARVVALQGMIQNVRQKQVAAVDHFAVGITCGCAHPGRSGGSQSEPCLGGTNDEAGAHRGNGPVGG